MATENLQEKIAQLRAQITQLDVNLFSEQMQIEDAAEPTGDENADAALKTEAMHASIRAEMMKRRMVVRKAKLAELEKELAERPPKD